MKRILVVKTSSLGDVIHMLPAVTDARRMHPELIVDWLVEESFAAIPSWHSAVERVVPIAMRRWKTRWAHADTWHQIGAARSAVRAQSYDLIVDSQGLFKSAVWTRLARGRRVGYDRTSAREPIAALFYDTQVSVPPPLHAIERNRRLMADVLTYSMATLPLDHGIAARVHALPASTLSLPLRYVVGLHGTSRADKEWPVANWLELARALAQAGQPLVLPWGNETERQRASEIAAGAEGTVVLPKSGLAALAAIIHRAQAVVGVDTGLMHLAAALGKPGLALYTATRPTLTGVVADVNAQAAIINIEAPKALQAHSVTARLMQCIQAP